MSAAAQVTPLILTLDERENLPRTLDSLAWAERVVVVDSLSSDGTREIAQGYPNVSLFERPFDSFRAQWEFGVRETAIETDYVLALDADMQVPSEVVRELEDAFLPQQPAGGLLGFEYRYDGEPLRGSLVPPQLRLFRPDAGGVQVTQPGHTQAFSVDGPVYRFQARLVHDDRKHSLERWMLYQLGVTARERQYLTSQVTNRLKDRLRRSFLMPPLAGALAYVRAGGPLGGRTAARYAYERLVYEGLLALRLLRQDEESSESLGDHVG